MPRATRYPLTLPLRFRPAGADQWSYGLSVNISHTGILFETSRDVDVRDPLDIEVVLPGDGEEQARIVTRAVVRRATNRGGEEALAVSLSGAELLRGFGQGPR